MDPWKHSNFFYQKAAPLECLPLPGVNKGGASFFSAVSLGKDVAKHSLAVPFVTCAASHCKRILDYRTIRGLETECPRPQSSVVGLYGASIDEGPPISNRFSILGFPSFELCHPSSDYVTIASGSTSRSIVRAGEPRFAVICGMTTQKR
jgi:hypothetical protein